MPKSASVLIFLNCAQVGVEIVVGKIALPVSSCSTYEGLISPFMAAVSSCGV